MASRVLRAFIGAARGHVEQAGRATGVAYGGQVDDHGDVTVTLECVVFLGLGEFFFP